MQSFNSNYSFEGSILQHRPDISLYYRTPCHAAKFCRRKRSLETVLDYFSTIGEPDVLYKICWYLNKKDLLRFMATCKRFYEIGLHAIFWHFLNLGNKHVSESSLHNLIDRKIKVFRLASATIYSEEYFGWYNLNKLSPSFLTYLDLSQTKFTHSTALAKLLSRCQRLQALSLESCEELNEETGVEIAKNKNLQILNLMMSKIISTKAIKMILTKCKRLRELSVGWANFTDELIVTIASNLPLQLLRLNFSGTRDFKEMNDDLFQIICDRCPNLEELDMSDDIHLSSSTIEYLSEKLTNIKIVSFSRCYGIEPTSFLKLAFIEVLNIYGCVTDEGAEFLRGRLRPTQINVSPFSTIARPTVGDNVTSIWKCRTKDWY